MYVCMYVCNVSMHVSMYVGMCTDQAIILLARDVNTVWSRETGNTLRPTAAHQDDRHGKKFCRGEGSNVSSRATRHKILERIWRGAQKQEGKPGSGSVGPFPLSNSLIL